MRCGSCQTENRPGRRFCAQCGGRLPSPCRECQFENEPDESFCGGCGLALAPQRTSDGAEAQRPGERRPVTVLFADLSGYTRLSSTLDPEDVHQLLEKFFSKTDGAIADLGGTIDKHIGDNVMALFGAPVAHDNDPERAVRAAIEIHARAAVLSEEVGREVTVHVGIASGEVVASGLGSQHHQAYTVIGDAANLAARLQDKATACETLVSDPVYRATRHVARYQAVGEVSVKGLAVPVQVWKLLGLGQAEPEQELAFVGRSAEMAELRALLEGVRERRSGAAIHIRGEPGIGKTRLASELLAHGHELGFQSHRALVLDFGVAQARDPVRSLAESLLGLPAGAGDQARELELAAMELDEGLAPFVRDLVGLGMGAEDAHAYEQMDHVARASGKKRAFGSLLQRAARARSTLVLVENLHWADGHTLETVAALAHAAASCPAVVVFTSRVEGDPLDVEVRAAMEPTPVTTLDLTPLREADAVALCAAVLGDDPEVAKRCVERAGGNPLFLLQLLENMREGGDQKLPGTLQSLVLARADRLSDAHRQALTAAAVIGQRFALATLRAVLEDATYVPNELVSHSLLRPDGDELLFQHALIRDGVYSSLTRAHRRALHARAAEYFRERDATLHAEHLHRAEDERAPRAYLAAARAQAEGFLFERAFRSLDVARALARESSDLHAISMLQGELALEVGDARLAERSYAAALTAAGVDLERCRALIGRAASHRRLSEHERGMADLEEAQQIAARLELALELAQIHYYRGSLCFALAKRKACLDEHRLALENAARASSPLWRARALSGLGDASYALGEIEAAADNYRRCIEECEANGFDRIAIPNRLMLCFGEVFQAQLTDVAATALEVVETAVRLGDRHGEMFARHLVSLAHILRGDMERGLGPAERALELSRSIHARRFEAEFLGVLAEARVGLGQPDEARALLLPGLEIARETGIGYVGPWLLALLAYLSDAPGEQRRHLAEAEALLEGDVMFYNHFFARRWAIELGIRVQDLELIEHHARALLEASAVHSLQLFQLFADRGLVWAAFLRGDRTPELAARVSELEGAKPLFTSGFTLPTLDGASATP